MATTRVRNGNWYIEFTCPQGSRRTLSLGKVSATQAYDCCRNVERLLSAKSINEPPDPRTLQWLRGVSPRLHEKLSALGLDSFRPAQTLGDLCQRYKDSLTCKAATIGHVEQATDSLTSFLGRDRFIQDVTPGDADEYKAHLYQRGGNFGQPLAESTVSRRCGRCRQIFGFAVKKRWLSDNPFGHISRSKESNRERDFYVPPVLVNRLIEIADPEFAAILAFARYAALRSPSETTAVRWSWVDWETDTITIHSPKTGLRKIPLFAELRPHLLKLWDASPERDDLLFPNHQITGTALTNKLQRLLRSVKEVLWPKPWNNMRASCETDLLSIYPALTVVKWVGHSLRISEKHYAQISKEHHDRAVAAGAAANSRTTPKGVRTRP